jgi:folate-binding protein YgfZ
MASLPLHDFHQNRGARFSSLNGFEIVSSYGSTTTEYEALTTSAGLLDLSFRGRVCLLGADREKFLHGQVTNDVQRLKTGQGCYAALVTAKGKIESDLFIYKLDDELLLDFEPGLTDRVTDRLNKYVIAEEVQIVDVAPHYGLLAVCGPKAGQVVESVFPGLLLPKEPFNWQVISGAEGDTYVINNPRYGVAGFDLFVPTGALEQIAAELEKTGEDFGTRWAGLDASEVVRIEHAIPRFGVDMTEKTLPQEAELQDRAVSFAKGCYIGQEVIARIRTYGQVAKALRLLRLQDDAAQSLPVSGTKIFVGSKEAGFVTSAAISPKYGAAVALAYVRKESNALGTVVQIGSEPGIKAEIIAVPGKA